MQLSSYFLAALVTVAPASAIALEAIALGKHHCSHFKTVYTVPCPDGVCKHEDVSAWTKAFNANKKLWEGWAKDNTAKCGGSCKDPVAVPKGFEAGYQWTMECTASRLFRKQTAEVPDAVQGLEKKNDNKCPNSCTPNGQLGEECYFNFGSC
ncbi:hypothetical protein FKW77_006429 [Venturia effusa]|uniref:Uncharacterized protein n=1 Tax=Venturia effusa TaxID=50376 RepID=A0A517LIZ9_9PEZI|nr:hypothetical protein FKW77_006429 [Venturia effusa]